MVNILRYNSQLKIEQNMTISFVTPRLSVVEVEACISLSERSQLLACVPTILTPAVVAALPPYFHGVSSPATAEAWLDRMLSQSRLLLVKSANNAVIGFLFVCLAMILLIKRDLVVFT